MPCVEAEHLQKTTQGYELICAVCEVPLAATYLLRASRIHDVLVDRNSLATDPVAEKA